MSVLNTCQNVNEVGVFVGLSSRRNYQYSKHITIQKIEMLSFTSENFQNLNRFIYNVTISN